MDRVKGIFMIIMGAMLWGATGPMMEWILDTGTMSVSFMLIIRLLLAGSRNPSRLENERRPHHAPAPPQSMAASNVHLWRHRNAWRPIYIRWFNPYEQRGHRDAISIPGADLYHPFRVDQAKGKTAACSSDRNGSDDGRSVFAVDERIDFRLCLDDGGALLRNRTRIHIRILHTVPCTAHE